MASMSLQVGIKGLKRGTDIRTIEVPEALRHRKKTGLDWFDAAIADSNGSEGFVPSSVMMFTGTPGAGKTTALLQLADAITKAGHICLYNSGEESLYQVKMVTERLGLRNGFIVGQDLMIDELLAHANALRAAHPTKQVFILQDSLQTLDDGKWADGANSKTALRCVEKLTDWAKAKYGVVIFIGQVNKDGEFQGKNGILHAVDIRAQIYVDRGKKSPTFGERIFEVQKNRFGVGGRAYVMGMGDKGLYSKGSYDMFAAGVEE